MPTSAHKVMRQKWRRWLKRIERDVFDLLIARHIYEGIGAIVLDNRDIQRPGDVHSWMSRNYGTATAIGIRRQADLRSDVTSLARLLKNIADNADAVTRESHVSHYPARLRDAGDAWIDNFAGPARQALPSKIPLRHLRELRDAAGRVRQLVNKRIAHLDQKNVRRKPVTFQDIHDVIGLLDRTVVEYKLLLNAVSPQPSLLPTWNYDWWEVFYDPWIKSPPPGWRRRSLG